MKRRLTTISQTKRSAPVGCSSAVLAFYEESIPVWAFHQLCAKKKPELLSHSGQLYAWRAEYLAARTEDIKVAAWFDGQSRWLERIYVKFANQSSGRTQLHAIKTLKCIFEKTDAAPDSSIKSYMIGKARRVACQKKGLLGATGPRFLNAAENLNGVAALWEPLDLSQIRSVGEGLANAISHNVALKVSLPQNYEVHGLKGAPQVEDRFSLFPKEDLVSFLASIEHSMAVTERKLVNE